MGLIFGDPQNTMGPGVSILKWSHLGWFDDSGDFKKPPKWLFFFQQWILGQIIFSDKARCFHRFWTFHRSSFGWLTLGCPESWTISTRLLSQFPVFLGEFTDFPYILRGWTQATPTNKPHEILQDQVLMTAIGDILPVFSSYASSASEVDGRFTARG